MPTYGNVYTNFQRQIISVFVFFYSDTLQNMLVDYAVIEMGWFGDYSDAAPHAKTIRQNGIASFLLHISYCIIVDNNNSVISTPVAEAPLK